MHNVSPLFFSFVSQVLANSGVCVACRSVIAANLRVATNERKREEKKGDCFIEPDETFTPAENASKREMARQDEEMHLYAS